MSNKVVSREEWLAARKALLVEEKELTRANEALAAKRRNLPMVKVDKTYNFKAADGSSVTLDDLFDGNEQLIVYHFMFGPDTKAVCSGCYHVGESLPKPEYLRQKGTNMVCISRAPVEKLTEFKQTTGWSWDWYSSGESDFNYDFHATLDDAMQPVQRNFRDKVELEKEKKAVFKGDIPGISVFLKVDGQVYHTYSTFERGLESVLPTMALLDMTPLGRRIGPNGPGDFKRL